MAQVRINRYLNSAETVIFLRRLAIQYYYNDKGEVIYQIQHDALYSKIINALDLIYGKKAEEKRKEEKCYPLWLGIDDLLHAVRSCCR